MYIGIPTDMIEMKVDSAGLFADPLDLPNAGTSSGRTGKIVDAVAIQIQTAHKSAVIVDIEASQYSAQSEILDLVRLTGLPTFIRSGRVVIREDTPGFGGVHGGMWSSPWAREYVESVDLVLRIGMLYSESFSVHIEQDKLI